MGQSRSFGDVGSMSGLPESGHGWALYEYTCSSSAIVRREFHHARIDGDSMAPLFRNGDHVLVSTLPYRFGEPRREDVVALYYPLNPVKSFVERVIGEEGDVVRIADGRVYVNDVLKNDAYVPAEFRSHDFFGPQVVQEGYFFVMGDHRNGSTDSRHWGVVPKKYVWGRVVATIWRARPHQSNSPR